MSFSGGDIATTLQTGGEWCRIHSNHASKLSFIRDVTSASWSCCRRL